MTRAAGAIIDIADFGTSGTVPVPLSGGTTDGATQAWLVGGVCGVEFNCRIGTATHNTVIGTVPNGYRPPYTATINLVPNSTTPTSAFVQIDTLGVITLYMYGGGSATTIIRGSTSYPKAP